MTESKRPPFRGAIIHMEQLLRGRTGLEERRQAVGEALDSFQASGITAVMPYATTTAGSACYPSQLLGPKALEGWDALECLAQEARKRGLQFWPVVCVIPSGGKELKGILHQHPQWALLSEAGQPQGYISPWNPQARAWLVSLLQEIVSRYEPDGLLLDYLRFPSEAVRPDVESAPRFAREYPGFEKASPSSQAQQLQRFKEQGLTELTEQLSRQVRATKPGLRLGLYSWGPQVLKAHLVAQDWRTWIERGYIDMVSISGYCYPDNCGPKFMEAFEQRLKDAAQIFAKTKTKAELTFTLGVRTSHGQVTEARQIGAFMEAARRVGIHGVVIFTWSYLQPFLAEVNRAGYLKEPSPKAATAGAAREPATQPPRK